MAVIPAFDLGATANIAYGRMRGLGVDVAHTPINYGGPHVAFIVGAGTDPNPPVIASFVAPTTRSGAVTFQVTDLNPGLRLVQIWLKFTHDARTELVYNGTQFLPRFSGTVTPIANGLAFSVTQNGGWDGDAELFWIQAVDQHGNVEALP